MLYKLDNDQNILHVLSWQHRMSHASGQHEIKENMLRITNVRTCFWILFALTIHPYIMVMRTGPMRHWRLSAAHTLVYHIGHSIKNPQTSFSWYLKSWALRQTRHNIPRSYVKSIDIGVYRNHRYYRYFWKSQVLFFCEMLKGIFFLAYCFNSKISL